MENIFDAAPSSMSKIRSAIKAETLIRVAIAFCSCFAFAGFLTLHLAHAQDRISASERVAVTEGRVEAARADLSRLESEMIILRKDVSDGREKISELNSKLSQVYGVGMGLAAIMLILQAAQMLLPRPSRKHKNEED